MSIEEFFHVLQKTRDIMAAFGFAVGNNGEL